MSQINQGQQRIGWKYQTPLQATYLNTLIAGFSSPGLLTRPKLTVQQLPSGMNVTIDPFSLLIVPIDPASDPDTQTVDENGEDVSLSLVKITTTKSYPIQMPTTAVAIGFQYSFAEIEEGSATPGNLNRQWFGDFVVITPDKIPTFKGLYIATVQVYQDHDNYFYSVTTSGADISDMLLIKEGWNPNQWLSVVHPRRCNGVYNQLEVRRHNSRFSGYVNGFGGLNKINESDVVYNLESDPAVNPEGTRGFMPAGYCAFKLQSDEFGLCAYGNTLPLDKTPGATFAIVDGSLFNNPTSSNYHAYPDSFTNNLKISPVKMANTNSFFDEDTLYII